MTELPDPPPLRLAQRTVRAIQKLPDINNRATFHVFDPDSVMAVSTAMACGRPLLVRGEPGTGKSQLAVAVAMALERVPLIRVVDAHTDPHALMWSYDAVGRLAQAQAYGALCAAAKDTSKVERPDRERYVIPGPLWWAFNWVDALRQANVAKAKAPTPPKGTKLENGVVLLVDEIDKADITVPNALLDCLGSGRFHVPGVGEICKQTTEPLVVFTTNTDRALPNAFVRRCVVLHMRVPKTRPALLRYLIDRGQRQFPKTDAQVIEAAADKVARDRAKVSPSSHDAPPGLAEYIDLLAALENNPELKLDDIAAFVLSKHRDPGPLEGRRGDG